MGGRHSIACGGARIAQQPVDGRHTRFGCAGAAASTLRIVGRHQKRRGSEGAGRLGAPTPASSPLWSVEPRVDLPGAGEPKRAILDTFTKEHSVAYHCQPMVDLAFRMRMMIEDTEAIETVTIHSKRQTHMVTGSGSNDPQKYDPKAGRETLDHSIMYAFAVALEDGEWHHERSYLPERSGRPETVRLWRKVKTVEDDEWNRRFADAEPLHKPQGGRVEITFADREPLVDEIDFADAHPQGARPFARPEYIRKFETLCEGVVEAGEIARFIESVQDLPALAPDALGGLNVEVPPGSLECAKRDHRGIF